MICNTCGNDRRVWGCRCEEVQQIADLRAALAAERKAGDSKQQRIEDVVRELAMVTKRREETQQLWEAERKRVAELERDRERLQCLVRGIVSNAQREPDPWEDTWTVRLSHDFILELQAIDAAREAKG